ncbi:MAG: DUF58 domain-containing protein [Proteobacteria bacterium]|nr:DUF58 domain-containing protein [Pseudomonadota bacterium]
MIRQFFNKSIETILGRRGREKLPVSFHWKRIYVLPSKVGLFFVFIWLVMLLASLNFNNNMSLMLVFLLFGLSQVVMLRTFFNLKDLMLNSVEAQAVFCGEDAKFVLNLTAKQDRFNIFTKEETVGECFVDVQADKSAKIKISKPTQTRGWQKMTGVKLSTRFPLGLFTVWVYLIPKAKVLVYPRPESPTPVFPLLGGIEGDRKKQAKGDDISGIREYRAGDPVRDIAWKKTAQSDKVLLKEYLSQQAEQLIFDYAELGLSHTEKKLSRLTAWVVQAEKLGLNFQLILPGYSSEMSSGSKHVNDCLIKLALFNQGTNS